VVLDAVDDRGAELADPGTRAGDDVLDQLGPGAERLDERLRGLDRTGNSVMSFLHCKHEWSARWRPARARNNQVPHAFELSADIGHKSLQRVDTHVLRTIAPAARAIEELEHCAALTREDLRVDAIWSADPQKIRHCLVERLEGFAQLCAVVRCCGLSQRGAKGVGSAVHAGLRLLVTYGLLWQIELGVEVEFRCTFASSTCTLAAASW